MDSCPKIVKFKKTNHPYGQINYTTNLFLNFFGKLHFFYLFKLFKEIEKIIEIRIKEIC